MSGFTAAVKIKQFALCPFDAMATAVSVFCSQNLGAGQAKRIRQGLFQGMAVAVGYGIFAGLVLIVFGRSLSMMFLSRDNVEVLDASAKYLRCMGFFYWSLGILNVSRMVTQGLGFSGRAFFSGVTEMIARIIVSVGFVGTFGYTAICFADQTAWVSACCYIFPTCLRFVGIYSIPTSVYFNLPPPIVPASVFIIISKFCYFISGVFSIPAIIYT